MGNLRDDQINMCLEKKNTIISVHIPKTAGTSFANILKNHFGDEVYLDYADRVLATPPEKRLAFSAQALEQNLRNIKNYRVIHGHFMPAKYLKFKTQQTKFVMWFRDPIARLMSRYYHGRRVKQDPFFKQSPSLLEFCQQQRFQNTYSQYLDGFKLEYFDFIGSTEHFSNDIQCFARQFHVTVEDIPQSNSNPLSTQNKYGDLDNETINAIRHLNQDDMNLYEQAMIQRQHILNKYRNDK